MARPDAVAPALPGPAPTPREIVLPLGEPVAATFPLTGQLRVVMPGARYALQVDSDLPVYLPAVERLDRVQIRPHEDLLVKAVALTIEGQPGQEVGLLAAPRRAEPLKAPKSARRA